MKTSFIKVLFILIILSLSNLSHAKNKKQFMPDKTVRSMMNNISGTMRKLGPYIASESEFTKDKNSKLIERELNSLSKLFNEIKLHPVIATEGLSINQSLMSEQLNQTVNLFKTNKRSLARAKFNAALNLCVSCHTQSPGLNLPKLFPDKEIETLKISLFEKAELYFVSRDYEKAMSLYNEFIEKSKKTDDDEFIFLSLERELVYFVKIKKSFAEGKLHFEKLLKLNIFNERITTEVREWVLVLGGKSLWDGFDPAQTKEEEMDKFMKNFIADEETGPIFTVSQSSEVYDLNLSTILLDYYNAHPETKLGAKILYWMAILDKRVNGDLFYSIGDYYLLSCMEKYSHDPVASECFEAYVEELETHYFSKEKKEFPKELILKLNNLKKLINYKDE